MLLNCVLIIWITRHTADIFKVKCNQGTLLTPIWNILNNMWKIYMRPDIKEEKFSIYYYLLLSWADYRLLTCELEVGGGEMPARGQTPPTERGAAPVNVLVLQERPQSMWRRLLWGTGQAVLTVDTDSGLVLLKLICVSTAFLSPYFLECVPGERVAGALRTGAAVQRITESLLVMRSEAGITNCLSKLTFGTIWAFQAGLLGRQPEEIFIFYI